MRYVIGLLLFACLWACSDDDYLNNDAGEVNFFAVPDDATGEEADLRRSFFNETGIYLLFSDTLGVREVPTLSGDVVEVPQILRLEWNMVSGTAVDSFVCHAYTDFQAKQAAADFIRQQVVPNLPATFHPYSFLLLDRLEQFEDPWGSGVFNDPVDITSYSGMQAMAVAIHDIGGMTTEEQSELANSLVRELLVSRISVIPDEAWTDFYEYSEDYYDINSYNVPTPIQSVGFLETYYYDFGVAYNTHEYDLQAYVQEIFNQTEEEFRAAYAAYPIVISKMEEVVRVLQSYGVRIYE